MMISKYCKSINALVLSALAAAPMPVLTSTSHAQSGQVPAAAPSAPDLAAANINITPRRIVFEGPKRTEAVYIFNQGTVPTTVDVTLVDNVMLPTGEIVPLTIARERGGAASALADHLQSAKDMLLAAPSRLTIAPGSGKTVRLLVRPQASATGQAAEYRTHLTVTTVPAASSGFTADEAVSGRNEFSFRIQTVFGISIPVIVRSGGAAATANLESASMVVQPATPLSAEAGQASYLDLMMSRSGAGSVYGNIEIRVGKARSGEVIGQVRGIAIYPELERRNVRVPLIRQPRRGETLYITYFADGDSLGGALSSLAYVAP